MPYNCKKNTNVVIPMVIERKNLKNQYNIIDKFPYSYNYGLLSINVHEKRNYSSV